MNIFFLLLLSGLMQATRSFTAGPASGSIGTALGFGYLLLAGFFAGKVFKAFKLPKLTGYLMMGVIAGPSLLRLVNEQMLQQLQIVNGMANVLIALTAGVEFEFAAMRPLMRGVKWLTGLAVFGTTLLLALVVYFARDLLPFMALMGPLEAMVVALLLGLVMVPQSPAVVVALRDEMKADGPLTRTVLGVVVAGNIVVIVLFALVSAAAKATLGEAGGIAETVRHLIWNIFGSLILGAGVGMLLAGYLKWVKRSAALFILTVAFVIAEVGLRIELDPLILALAAGMVMRNMTKQGDELSRHVALTSLPVYVVFFAVAGATLHLDVLAVVGIPALIFVVVRALGIFVGSNLAARVVKAPEAVRRYSAFGLLPQAGLALALSQLFTRTFPEFGDQASALTLGAITINELVAPALYRAALVRSGEAGQLAQRAEADEEELEAPETA